MEKHVNKRHIRNKHMHTHTHALLLVFGMCVVLDHLIESLWEEVLSRYAQFFLFLSCLLANFTTLFVIKICQTKLQFVNFENVAFSL